MPSEHSRILCRFLGFGTYRWHYRRCSRLISGRRLYQKRYRIPWLNSETKGFLVQFVGAFSRCHKADGVVKKSELDYVKQFFLHNFGQEQAEKYILTLREILKQDIQVAEVSQQIGRYMDYSSRLQLLHYLFGIAAADGQVHETEVAVIQTIANYMGVYASDFESIKAMFVKQVDDAYTILGIDPSASDEDVKKAYREMAKKNHPDKVSYLGEDVRKAAEQKFQEINNAYDKIKKQRGMA